MIRRKEYRRDNFHDRVKIGLHMFHVGDVQIIAIALIGMRLYKQ